MFKTLALEFNCQNLLDRLQLRQSCIQKRQKNCNLQQSFWSFLGKRLTVPEIQYRRALNKMMPLNLELV